MNSVSPKGYLQVRVSSSREAFPEEGAIVLISEKDMANGETGIVYSLRTDESGLTPRVPLDAAMAYLSESPGNYRPFRAYTVEVVKEGFYKAITDEVQIFEGISATLPVDLVPLGYSERTERENGAMFGEGENGDRR